MNSFIDSVTEESINLSNLSSMRSSKNMMKKHLLNNRCFLNALIERHDEKASIK